MLTLAEEWALKAAALGHVEAMYWLGEGYAFYAKDTSRRDPEAKLKPILDMHTTG